MEAIVPRTTSTKSTASALYVGTNRSVAALNARTGEELWRTKLPHQAGSIVTLLMSGAQLYAGCGGRVYCLDARTGDVIWENGLPKLGYQPVLLAMPGADAVSSPEGAIAAWESQQQQQAATAGGGGAS
jgi:outer membrane protein assembly factor BamB